MDPNGAGFLPSTVAQIHGHTKSYHLFLCNSKIIRVVLRACPVDTMPNWNEAEKVSVPSPLWWKWIQEIIIAWRCCLFYLVLVFLPWFFKQGDSTMRSMRPMCSMAPGTMNALSLLQFSRTWQWTGLVTVEIASVLVGITLINIITII